LTERTADRIVIVDTLEFAMKTNLTKWGNSLAIRIPSAFAEEIHAYDGAEVDLSVSRGKIVIAPLKRKYDLKELVDGITAENRHEETDWGKPAGKEIW
jgi:antitoxin MazE